MKTSLLVIALAVSLPACSRPPLDGDPRVDGDAGLDGDLGADGGTDGGTDAGTDAVAPAAALIELRQKCLDAGGQFAAGECLCPTQDVGGAAVRKTFDARVATCAMPEPFGDSECVARGGFAHVLDNEGLDPFRACVGHYLGVYPFRGLEIEIPATWTRDDARPLAKWLDDRFPPGAVKLNAKLSTPVTTDSVHILLASTSVASEIVSVSVSPPAIDPGDRSVSSGFSATRYLHVPSVEALDWALGDDAAARPARVTVPPAEAGIVGRALEAALAQTHLDVDGATTVEPILQRCLGMCDVRQDYTLDVEGTPYSAWRIRTYETGVLYRETLAIGSPDRLRVDGMVIFDLGGDPSLILRVERPSRLKTTVLAYDRNWNTLGTFPFDLFPDADKASAVVHAAAPMGDGEAGIVLCDSGLTFDDDAVNAALLVGEHLASPAQPNGSALGWFAASENDAVGFLDGVRTAPLGITLREAFPDIHGAGIARILLEHRDPKVRIVPASFIRCLRRPDALQDVAAWDVAHSATEANKRRGRIRVVNMSAADIIDAEACDARFPKGLDDHYLWVTAAGNSERTYTPETPLSRCPQTLHNRRNLLVIAGAEGLSPHPYSDVGSTYADLAADCAGHSGNCGGTSNSAPRVSRTAALIVQKFGDAISNEMVRMVILLGATVTTPAPPYRSGGFLNHEDAMTLAGSLISLNLGQNASLKRADAQRVVDTISAWSDGYKKQKLDLLEGNGAFER